ncbi:hypothetical protein ACFWMG_29035 [Streptomyces sp. NPDC127074]
MPPTSPCLGNPVAVVLDGADITDEEMRRLARWTPAASCVRGTITL